MRPYSPRFITLFLLLLLLAACGDATGTVAPAAQPTPTQATTPIPNQQITPAPGQLPTKTSQPAATPAKTNVPTSTPTPVKPEFIPVNVGQNFQLGVNQIAHLLETGEVITFLSISEDSRCPESDGNKSVVCAWAGQISALVQVKRDSDPALTVKLTLPGAISLTNIPASAITNLGNNQLQLLKVEPRKIIDKTINPADYVVTLQITGTATPSAQPVTTPVANQQATTFPGQLPTKTRQPATPTQFINTDATPVAINTGQPFQLKINQTAFLPTNNVYITFSSVTEDSRCPTANGAKSVSCYWSGQVSAQLQVKQANKPAETVKLTVLGGTPVKAPDTAFKKLDKGQLQLTKVDPYPVLDIDINPADYVVTLLITNG